MRRLLVLMPLLALLGSGLSACGEEEADAAELIRGAPAALEEAGSMRMAMTMEVAGQTIEADGEFDVSSETGSMTMEAPPPVGGAIEMVFDGTVIYMSSDLFGSELPADVQWLRMDLEELMESQAGVDLNQLTQGSSDPTDVVGALEGISDDGVEVIGTEEIRGVETTGYSATIDVEAAYEEVDGVIDEELFDRITAQFGDEPLETEVWLDDDGLVRRQVMVLPIQGQEMTQTMEFYDYGEPVDIEVPDESDSIDFLDLVPEF